MWVVVIRKKQGFWELEKTRTCGSDRSKRAATGGTAARRRCAGMVIAASIGRWSNSGGERSGIQGAGVRALQQGAGKTVKTTNSRTKATTAEVTALTTSPSFRLERTLEGIVQRSRQGLGSGTQNLVLSRRRRPRPEVHSPALRRSLSSMSSLVHDSCLLHEMRDGEPWCDDQPAQEIIEEAEHSESTPTTREVKREQSIGGKHAAATGGVDRGEPAAEVGRLLSHRPCLPPCVI